MISAQVSTTNPGASVNTMTVDNSSIVAIMNKFQERVAQLHFSYCTTCKESFPTVTLCAQSSECTRCSRDSRTPKLYKKVIVIPYKVLSIQKKQEAYQGRLITLI